MEIEQQNTEEKGLFKASENNIEAGIMTYTWAGTDRFIIDHTEVKPEFKGKIKFTEQKLEHFDAVIATGSDNTARYFEFYFKDKPSIIRKNRFIITDSS